jgi:circadian clock protein KaiC
MSVSPIITGELPDLVHVGRLAEYGISHLADSVILLQRRPADTRPRRTVIVLKSRATAHDPDIREFEITPGGIVLAQATAGA